MLKISYEELETSAKSLIEQKSDFDTCVESMQKIVDGLPDIWEAETCTRYVEQFAENKKALTDVSELIQDMAEQMRKIASNFKDADTDMAGQM